MDESGMCVDEGGGVWMRTEGACLKVVCVLIRVFMYS